MTPLTTMMTMTIAWVEIGNDVDNVNYSDGDNDDAML